MWQMWFCFDFMFASTEPSLYYVNVYMVLETTATEALKEIPIVIKGNNTERNTRSHVPGPTVQRILFPGWHFA